MKLKQLGALLLVGTMLAGCYNDPATGQPSISKQTIGGLVGGIAGAAAASNVGKGKGQIAATAAGALLGAALGGGLGASLDSADQMRYQQAGNQTFETAKTGQTVSWVNPDSGNSGTFTPTKTYNSNDGQVCREYSQTVTIGGKKQNAYGVACRQSDGSWQIKE